MAPANRPDLDRLTAAVDALGAAFVTAELETMTVDDVKSASSQVNRAANMIDGLRADLARRSRNLQPPGQRIPPRDLDPKHQRSPQQAERDSKRADLFDEYTELGEATRRGDLPGDYADAINQAVARLTNTERTAFLGHHRQSLTTKALGMGLHEFRVHLRGLVDDFCRASQLERFQQQCRQRSGKVWDDPISGMTKVFAEFDPETGARIRHAIDNEIDRLQRNKRDDPDDTRTHGQLVADAIANLTLDARRTGKPHTDLVVLVDLHTLVTDTSDERDDGDIAGVGDPADRVEPDPPPPRPGGRCCETADGTALPIETVRRLACEANILPAVLNGHGAVVDLGRSQRLASEDQRKALETMYATCAFDECTVPFDRCEMHHIDPWAPPTCGTTDLHKLVPACQFHHHDIHDHHLQLSLDPVTRLLSVTRSDGTREHHRFHDRRRPPPVADLARTA